MISVDIGIDNDMVCVILGDEPVNYLSMSPDEARVIARNLIEVADFIYPAKSTTKVPNLFKALQNTINDLMSLRNRD